MRIGEVVTEEGEKVLVTSVIWLGVETVTTEPYNPDVNGHKVRPNYQSRIGEVAPGGLIIGESIIDSDEIEYILGDESYFDPANENDPLFSDFLVISENELHS